MNDEVTFASESLLSDLKRGDERALCRIIHLYRKKLLLQSYFILDDMDEASDVVQEVFINFWRIKGSLADDTSLDRYLSKATKYESVHKLNKMRSRPKRLIDLNESFVPCTFNNKLENTELNQQLMCAINSLPQYQRRDFIAMYLEGKSQKLIASEQNKGLQTVKNNIHEALRSLRGKLEFLIR